MSLFTKPCGEKMRTRPERNGSEIEYMKNLLISIVFPTMFCMVEGDGLWEFGDDYEDHVRLIREHFN